MALFVAEEKGEELQKEEKETKPTKKAQTNASPEEKPLPNVRLCVRHFWAFVAEEAREAKKTNKRQKIRVRQ